MRKHPAMTRRALLKSLLLAPLAAIVGAKIPQSFKDGLADCEAGRVTQMTDEAFTAGGLKWSMTWDDPNPEIGALYFDMSKGG